jgi:hypothetical protein
LVLKQADEQTKVLFRSDSTLTDRERERQLLGVMATFAEGGEDDGTSLLLESVLRRAERESNQNFVGLSLERKSASDETFQTIYYANIVRLDGEVRFVPALEKQRTVLSLASNKGATR